MGTADDILWMTVNTLKQRAQTALSQADLNEKRSQMRTTKAKAKAASKGSYQQMRKTWHRPPHIVVTKTGVSFGESWPAAGFKLIPPGDEAPPGSRDTRADPEPEPPDIGEGDKVDDDFDPFASEGLPPPLDFTDIFSSL